MLSSETQSDVIDDADPDGAFAIELSDLVFRYDKRNSQALLDIPNWQVLRGEQVFLYGPSGSGKSTLLNLLGGVLRPERGQIRLLNTNMGELSSRRRDRFRARHIGIVFQQFNLIPYLSVIDNILLAAHFSSDTRDAKQRASELFERLHLPAVLLARRADLLSVGQQQRVAIARALINGPELLIADEPSSALDSDARDRFMTLLLQVCQLNQSTLVFVSHDRSLDKHFQKTVDLANINHVKNT